MMLPTAAVIVLSWNGAAVLPACMAALREQTTGLPRVVLVDNGSHDDSIARVQAALPGVEVIAGGWNRGFAGGMNLGIRALLDSAVPPQIVVLLNQDTVVAPNWLEQLLTPCADDERLAAIGCKIYYPDGVTLQHAGAEVRSARLLGYHIGWHERDQGQYDQPREVEYVTGAAVALRADALRDVGLLDAGYYPAYYEEVDLCWRLRRSGYRICYTPSATLRHVESLSLTDPLERAVILNRSRLRFLIKTRPAAFILEEFAPAERAYIAEVNRIAHGVEARVLRLCYLEAIARLPEWMHVRIATLGATDIAYERLRELLLELSDALRYR